MANKNDVVRALIGEATGALPGPQARAVKTVSSALPKLGTVHPDRGLTRMLTRGGWGEKSHEELEDFERDAARWLQPVADVAAELFPPQQPGQRARRSRARAAAGEQLADDGRDTEVAQTAAYRASENRLRTEAAQQLARFLRVVDLRVQVCLPPPGAAPEDAPQQSWDDYDRETHLQPLVERVVDAAAAAITARAAAGLDTRASFVQLLKSHQWSANDPDNWELAEELARGWEDAFDKTQLDRLQTLPHPESLRDWKNQDAEKEWLCAGAQAARDYLNDQRTGPGNETASNYASRRAKGKYGWLWANDQRPPAVRPGTKGDVDDTDPAKHAKELAASGLPPRALQVRDTDLLERLARAAVISAEASMQRKAQRRFLLPVGAPSPFKLADPDDEIGWVFQSMRQIKHGLQDAWKSPHKLQATGAAAVPSGLRPMTGLVLVAQHLAAEDPDCPSGLADWFADLLDDDLEKAAKAVCQDRAPGPKDWLAVVVGLASDVEAQDGTQVVDWDDSAAQKAAVGIFRQAQKLCAEVAGTVDGAGAGAVDTEVGGTEVAGTGEGES